MDKNKGERKGELMKKRGGMIGLLAAALVLVGMNPTVAKADNPIVQTIYSTDKNILHQILFSFFKFWIMIKYHNSYVFNF